MKICPECQRSYPTSFAVCPQDGARLTEALEWAAGTVIRGKYKISGKIGEGGMGAVYKAVHMHFNEACALKVMAPGLMSDTGLVKRFGREAIIARKLRHENAVKVEDFDETEDGRPFIVMEYIEGQSLKSLMNAQGPLPVARTCAIIKQAAAALDAAHQLSLVHRDIKPDNIVLVFSGGREVAKVLDFGIAKVRDSQGGTSGMALTATGMVIGTPPYMSPEQAKGADSEEIDGRSDIYSLGVVMYQMLTGVLPLRADTPLNMLFAQIQTPPTPIYEAQRGLKIPSAVGDLVMKCLEKDRERRPQTGRQLIEELERCEKADPSYTKSSAAAKSFQDFSESTTIPDTPVRFASGMSSGRSTSQADAPTMPTPARIPPLPTLPPTMVEKPAAEAASAPPSREKSSSRTTVAILSVILVVVLGGGGWYFLHKTSSAVQQSAPEGSKADVPIPPERVVPPSTTSPSSGQESGASGEPHDAKPSSDAKRSSEPAAGAAETEAAKGGDQFRAFGGERSGKVRASQKGERNERTWRPLS